MVYEIVIGLLAIVGLLAGAEIVIDRAMRIAKRLNISGFFIGLTVFSIGTSLPEIAIHIISSVNILRGVGDIDVLSGLVIGTNIGSNIAQITFITGVVTLFGVLKATKKFLKVDYMIMIGAIVVTFLVMLNGVISRLEGAVLFLMYAGYLYYISRSDQVMMKVTKGLADKDRMKTVNNMLVLVGGLIVLLLSADRVAKLAELFSERYGISGSLLGTTLVGLTTSLPELMTAITALKRKNMGMSFGTLVGSNITNPLMGIGIGAMISTYTSDPAIVWYDLPFYFAISVVLLLIAFKKLTLNRFVGLFLIISYFAYLLGRIELF